MLIESFDAELMDGQSAAVRKVRVAFDIDSLELRDVTDGTRVGAWPLRGLRAEEMGGGVLHLTSDAVPGALLTTRSPEVGARLAARKKAVGGRELARGTRLRTALLYASALAAALGLVYLSLPALSAVIARRIPLAVEDKLALQIEPLLGRARCQSADADAALAALAQRLDRASPTGYPVEVGVIDMDVENAFTLPGGKVLITSALIEAAESPDEVAGVLAHELAHVAERHVMTQIVRGSILSLGWAATVGDFSGLFVVDPSVAYQIAQRGFGRDDERAADRRGLAMLDGAGISRAGLAAFFRRLEARTDGVPVFVSTHPASAERVKTIEAGGTSATTTPALDEAQWAALRGACAKKE